MKLHPRYALVARAKNKLSGHVLEILEEHDLTPLEMVGILITLAQDAHRLALRHERHGDYETKADEDRSDDYDYNDYGDDEPDEDYEFDCQMGNDGTCGLAGTEECDWDCPYNRD